VIYNGLFPKILFAVLMLFSMFLCWEILIQVIDHVTHVLKSREGIRLSANFRHHRGILTGTWTNPHPGLALNGLSPFTTKGKFLPSDYAACCGSPTLVASSWKHHRNKNRSPVFLLGQWSMNERSQFPIAPAADYSSYSMPGYSTFPSTTANSPHTQRRLDGRGENAWAKHRGTRMDTSHTRTHSKQVTQVWKLWRGSWEKFADLGRSPPSSWTASYTPQTTMPNFPTKHHILSADHRILKGWTQEIEHVGQHSGSTTSPRPTRTVLRIWKEVYQSHELCAQGTFFHDYSSNEPSCFSCQTYGKAADQPRPNTPPIKPTTWLQISLKCKAAQSLIPRHKLLLPSVLQMRWSSHHWTNYLQKTAHSNCST
jgi:hypothetical protein